MIEAVIEAYVVKSEVADGISLAENIFVAESLLMKKNRETEVLEIMKQSSEAESGAGFIYAWAD